MQTLADITSSNCVGYQQFAYDEEIGVAEAGAAFLPINADNKWVCESQIFGNDVVEGDVLYLFSIDVWNLDYFQFKGFKGEVPQGWAYYTSDPETGDMLDSVVASFELNPYDQTMFQPVDMESGLNIAGQVAATDKPQQWVLPADVDIAEIFNPYPIETTLADLETFVKLADVIYVFNPMVWNLDYYQFKGFDEKGQSNGWAFYTSDPETGDMLDSVITDTSLVVLPAGKGGLFQPADYEGRTWTVSLSK